MANNSGSNIAGGRACPACGAPLVSADSYGGVGHYACRRQGDGAVDPDARGACEYIASLRSARADAEAYRGVLGRIASMPTEPRPDGTFNYDREAIIQMARSIIDARTY